MTGDDVYLERLHCDWEAKGPDRGHAEDAGRGPADA